MFVLLVWDLKALAENVEVEFDDVVRHLEVEQKAVFNSDITLVVQFNSHNRVNVEVVRLLHTLYAAVFHQVVFTGQQRPDDLDSNISWTFCEEYWVFFNLCLVYAMVEFPESSMGGYLFLGDDTMVRKFLPCCNHHEESSVQHAGFGAWRGMQSMVCTPRDKTSGCIVLSC